MSGTVLERGHWQYPPAPGSGGATAGVDTPDPVRTFFIPARTQLNTRSVALAPGVPELLSGASDSRKYALIVNTDTGITVFYGSSNQVTVGSGPGDPRAGIPILPGQTIVIDQREYVGDIYGVTAGTSPNVVDMRVSDPTQGA